MPGMIRFNMPNLSTYSIIFWTPFLGTETLGCALVVCKLFTGGSRMQPTLYSHIIRGNLLYFSV